MVLNSAKNVQKAVFEAGKNSKKWLGAHVSAAGWFILKF